MRPAGGSWKRHARSRATRVCSLLVLLVGPGACFSPAAPGDETLSVRGTWSFTGAQAAPSLQLTGQVVITGQEGDLITGRVSWEETDATGIVRVDGGPLSGRVIESSDLDFDVLLAGGTRRHVARLASDTMTGSWVQAGGAPSGAFRAVRVVGAVP